MGLSCVGMDKGLAFKDGFAMQGVRIPKNMDLLVFTVSAVYVHLFVRPVLIMLTVILCVLVTAGCDCCVRYHTYLVIIVIILLTCNT